MLVTRFRRAFKDLWTNTFHKERIAQTEALERRVRMQNEFRMVNRFEWFLRRLGIENYTIVPLDWDDHMEWYWNEYSRRVKEASQRKEASATVAEAWTERDTVGNAVSIVVREVKQTDV